MTTGATARIYKDEEETEEEDSSKKDLCACPLQQPLSPISPPTHKSVPPEAPILRPSPSEDVCFRVGQGKATCFNTSVF